MDFFAARDEYRKKRKEERNKISQYLRNCGRFKETKIYVKADSGSKKYKSGGRLTNDYDLSDWLWINIKLNSVNMLLSLQTFDCDPNTGNLHVLMDRIGIYVYTGEYSSVDACYNMMITDVELPVNDNDLEKLAKMIDDLSKCEIYKLHNQLTTTKNKFNLINSK